MIHINDDAALITITIAAEVRLRHVVPQQLSVMSSRKRKAVGNNRPATSSKHAAVSADVLIPLEVC